MGLIMWVGEVGMRGRIGDMGRRSNRGRGGFGDIGEIGLVTGIVVTGGEGGLVTGGEIGSVERQRETWGRGTEGTPLEGVTGIQLTSLSSVEHSLSASSVERHFKHMTPLHKEHSVMHQPIQW